MRLLFPIACACLLSFVFSGCKKPPKNQDIITHKPVVHRVRTTQKVGDYEQSREVEWLGSSYRVTVKREADTTLPVVEDDVGGKYYDNRITVRILRKDGSEFFFRVFKKSDFVAYVDDIYKKNSVLLGIVLDAAVDNHLRFAASVGSPDKMSDEYVPLRLSISRMGSISISKDNLLDTGTAQPDEDDDEI